MPNRAGDRRREDWGRRFLIVIAAAISIGFSRCPEDHVVLAQESDWSEPVMISTTTVKSWFSDIEVDGQGRAHIVWHSERREGQNLLDLLMYATWDGNDYSTPNDIVFPGKGGFTVRPAIAADRAARLHMIYRGNTDLYYTQSPADIAWNANTWSAPYLVSGMRSAYYSDIAVDSRGVIHLVWNEQPLHAEEKERRLWIGTAKGVSLLEGTRFLPSEDEPWAGDYAVHAMLEDSEGIQWLGTDDGTARFDGVTWKWLTMYDLLVGDAITTTERTQEVTTTWDVEVFAIAEDLDRTLWFGGEGLLCHYDPLQSSEEEQWRALAVPVQLSSARLQAIVVDDAGGLWVGTSGGLGRYDGQTWRVYEARDGLTSNDVRALVVDHQGALWAGTAGGLFRYSRSRSVPFGAEDHLGNTPVTAIAASPDEVLWVGTDSGLARYHNKEWEVFTERDGMISDDVTVLTVDSDGILWIGTDTGISRYDGKTWASYTVEDGVPNAQVTAMAEDELQNAMCPLCMDIFYRRSEDGGDTWTSPINLSRSYAGSVKPQIKIDADDGIHVTWEEGEDWYIGEGYPIGCVHRYSSDGGESWSDPFHFTHPDGAPQQITLGVGREGELVAVWRLALSLPDRSPVYYQRSTDHGASWSRPEAIADIIAKDWLPMSLDSSHAASDSEGNVHLLVLGYLDLLEENLSLLHVVWNGEEWSEPHRLYSSSNPPEWPRIAIGMGNRVHATWFTRDEAHIWDSERGRYQVWAARMVGDAPLLTPVPTPAPTPASLATSATPGVLTPSPPSTIAESSAPSSGIYTDFDDALKLLIALVPVLASLAVVFAVRVRNRR